MKFILPVLFLWTILFSINIQAQYYSFEKVPKWVKPVAIPTDVSTSKYDVSAGYYLSLSDNQVNYQIDEQYFHELPSVVSYSGITNASQLSISYDTSYQYLQIHSLNVWRKGKKIDYTKELTIELINNETNLNQGIYSGVITAYDILNDIRKGDLIEIEYTIIGSNPIFDRANFSFFPLEFSSQIDLLSVRYILSNDKKYTSNCIKCDSIEFLDTIIGSNREINITAKDIKVTEYDDYMPSWVLPSSYFNITSAESWAAVNIWAQKVFELKEEPKLDAVFEEILEGNETQEEKITKIIKYVQNDIRYMGIESGIGSIKPFSPEQVVKQRFGDCKDKSLLLVSLLKQIGVKEAYPALVNVSLEQKTNDLFPSGQIFDHCITMFKYDSTEYWIDPTVSLQGADFRNTYCYNFEKALVIGIPSDSLQDMNPVNVYSSTHLSEEIVVNSFGKASILKTTAKRYGKNADTRRAVLEYYSIDELSKSIVDDMKKFNPKIEETKDVVIVDNLDSNILTMNYEYSIEEHWRDGSTLDAGLSNYRYIFFKPQAISRYIGGESCLERDSDLKLEYPLDIKYSVIFKFPKVMLMDDTYEEHDGEVFFFRESIEQLSDKSFKVDYEFRTKAKSIKADRYKHICEEINEISKKLYVVIYF